MFPPFSSSQRAGETEAPFRKPDSFGALSPDSVWLVAEQSILGEAFVLPGSLDGRSVFREFADPVEFCRRQSRAVRSTDLLPASQCAWEIHNPPRGSFCKKKTGYGRLDPGLLASLCDRDDWPRSRDCLRKEFDSRLLYTGEVVIFRHHVSTSLLHPPESWVTCNLFHYLRIGSGTG